LSTKIHALTDRFCCPLTLLLSPGQAGDNPHLKPLLQAHHAGDTETFRLLADKAYSHPSSRAHLRAKKIAHTIPERSDQIARRKAKGSAGGRPTAPGSSSPRKHPPSQLEASAPAPVDDDNLARDEARVV